MPAVFHDAHRSGSWAPQMQVAKLIATDLNTLLYSSEQVFPNFWTDPTNGIPYSPSRSRQPLGESLTSCNISGVDGDFRGNRHADTWDC